ncbi:MAG: cytidine deaminase [Candidatus Krumholzibacteriia bacterium]
MIRLAALDARERELVRAARGVRARAHAPYSGFKVGAAVRSRDGRVFSGCNVENVSLGAGICAERGAVMQAVAEGVRAGQLAAVAVYTRDTKPTPPCGMCLQVLVEFGSDMDVFLANPRGVQKCRLSDLLPQPFTSFPKKPPDR